MSQPRGRPAGTLLARWTPALVFLLALTVDANSLPGTFIGDDLEIVVRNPVVQRLDLGAILDADYWGAGWNSGLHRPLTTLSFALNRAVFGPGPLSFHAVNVLLHAGAAALFALLLPALGFAPPLVLAAASLFAVHPIHADVVNIVVGRAELLAALLLFAGLWLALTKGRRAWPLVILCQLAALLSKEHAVVFLPLLAAADAFAARDPAAAWRSRRPLYALLLAVTLGWLLWRWWVLRTAAGPPLLVYAADNPLVGAGWATRLLTALKVNLLYLANLALPLRLQSVYSGPGLRAVGGALSPWGLGALAYGALCAAALARGWRARSAHGFGIPLFFAGFAVTANLFFVTSILMADRLAYLPSAGFCLAAAGLLLARRQRAATFRDCRRSLLPLAAYAILLGSVTLSRNGAFQDPEGFWSSVVAVEQRNVRAWFFLAQAAGERGKAAEEEAALRGAIRADPSFPDAFIALSLLLLDQGRPAEAAEAAAQGMAKAPGGVGLAQLALARAYVPLGRAAEALVLLDEVAPIFGDTFDFQACRGAALESLGRSGEAAAAYAAALAIREDGVLRRHLEGLRAAVEGAPGAIPGGVPP